MQLFVKLYGFKDFSGRQPLVINAEPTDAVSAIASTINAITGAPVETLTILSGLNVRIPSSMATDGFRKLRHNDTLSECGLADKHTLFASAPVPNSANATSAMSKAKRRSVCLAKAHYRPYPAQPLKTADVVAVIGDGSNSRTTLQYEGVEYSNALEWLAKAFNNSGRICCLPTERSHDAGTPRPTRYVPPSAACPFGSYS
jgi:hypothetical protein